MSAYLDILKQATSLRQKGEFEQARQLVQRNVQRTPRDPALWVLLSALQMEARQLDQAEFSSKKAVELAPNAPAALSALAQAYGQQKGKEHLAIDLGRRALAIDPKHEASISALSMALHRTGDLQGCREVLAKACATLARPGELRHNYARLLLELGRGPAAMEQIEIALRENSQHAELLRFAAMASHYSDALSQQDVFARHRLAGALAERHSILPALAPDAELASGARRIRIGFVSADFRSHSVASFIEPLLRGLDRSRFETSLWWTGDKTDDITARLRSITDAWHELVSLSDIQAARLIREQGIDVLCDLAAYTTGGRPGVFAMRPARVHVTMIGYPGTTGSSRMDARIVDAITDPVGPADALAAEKLIRLPGCFLCYQPPGHLIEVRPREHGPIVFGSFNNAAKISASTARLWQRVLDAVPGSRLFMKVKGVNTPVGEAFCREGLTAIGLDVSRVDLMPYTATVGEHLAMYHRVDIALDTYPYHGTTTTCEALWMGVPVISRVGEVHASRVGASLLSAAGLSELAAAGDDDYVRIACELAGNSARLSMLRASLRDQVMHSAICDQATYGKTWSAAIEASLGAV
jgi:predicted O-linked N-acetylglucosamine transferase (SPINDLY family)